MGWQIPGSYLSVTSLASPRRAAMPIYKSLIGSTSARQWDQDFKGGDAFDLADPQTVETVEFHHQVAGANLVSVLKSDVMSLERFLDGVANNLASLHRIVLGLVDRGDLVEGFIQHQRFIITNIHLIPFEHKKTPVRSGVCGRNETG